MQSLEKRRNAEEEGVNEEGQGQQPKVVVEHRRLSPRLADDALSLFFPVDVHEESV